MTTEASRLHWSSVRPRMVLTFSVLLALTTGLFVFAPSGVEAEGPVSGFTGFVVAAPDDPLPTKIRAMGADGVVCGTADVVATSQAVGFYDLTLTSGADRAGCPTEGGPFTFLLLFGSVDSGQVFDAGGDLRYQAGITQTQHIWVGQLALSAGWSGTPPPPGGYALMVWAGPDEAPVDQALALLPIEVSALYFHDAALKQFRMFVPGGPAFVQTYTVLSAGDIVVVKAG